MRSVKQRLVRWFHQNFHLIRRDQSNWEIQSKSFQGCLLTCLIVLPLLLAFFGFKVFLIFKIYPLVFSTVLTRLSIAPELGFPLVIVVLLGSFINLPLYLVAEHHGRGQYELLPICLLKLWCMPSYRTQFQAHTYIGLNVSGGLIPIVLALYQFHCTQSSAILIVTAIVTLISYFFVTVVPGVRIYFCYQRFWIVTIVAALAAMGLVAGGVNRLDVPVAFAGGVLGTTIGADLLHLRDVRPERAATPLSIGGAGLDDGIALCGLYALIIAEWLPAFMAGLSAHFK